MHRRYHSLALSYIYVAISIDVYNFFMLNVPFGVVQLNKRLNKTEEIVNYIKTLAPEAGVSGMEIYASHSVLWDAIAYPCLKYQLLAPKSSYKGIGDITVGK